MTPFPTTTEGNSTSIFRVAPTASALAGRIQGARDALPLGW
jgi:hypothetical protein